jgi:hypothetical protein
MRSFAIAGMLALAACTSHPLRGYVTPMSDPSGWTAALDIAGFVRDRLNPSDGAIEVRQPDGDALVGPLVVSDLQADGFTVSPRGRHVVRYAISDLDGLKVLQLSIDDTISAARLYDVKAGRIEPAGPFTVRGL